ncbi:hypothetical protein CIB48_g2348 [Xylaria polymorpha]|nr:hypothetical protein CIB48_g2348 [Xylaria polymorpha]
MTRDNANSHQAPKRRKVAESCLQCEYNPATFPVSNDILGGIESRLRKLEQQVSSPPAHAIGPEQSARPGGISHETQWRTQTVENHTLEPGGDPESESSVFFLQAKVKSSQISGIPILISQSSIFHPSTFTQPPQSAARSVTDPTRNHFVVYMPCDTLHSISSNKTVNTAYGMHCQGWVAYKRETLQLVSALLLTRVCDGVYYRTGPYTNNTTMLTIQSKPHPTHCELELEPSECANFYEKVNREQNIARVDRQPPWDRNHLHQVVDRFS